MTTENIVQDTEESRIAQQKRETLHSLLYIMAECAPSAEKFMGIDVKALARKVDEAYDQLGNQDCVAAKPVVVLDPRLLSDNVLAMYSGSTGEKTVCAEEVRLGSSFKASKKEYAKFPSYVNSISFGEIHDVDGQLRMEARISWSDGSTAEKSVWCGSLATPIDEAERIARERIWLYATSMSEPEKNAEEPNGHPTVLIALPAGAGQSLKPHEASFNLPEGFTPGQVSDGYHTFDELYAHRVRLFSTLMRAHPDKSWWSFKHHDGSVWDGWIIAGIDTPAGPATYHLPVSEIEFFNEGIRQLRRGKEWDGHTADDVLERLKSL